MAKVDPGVVPFYQRRTHGEWGVGIDAEPALDCWALGLPGFQGMDLQPGAAPRMSYTAAGYANGGSYQFHFPDGNASIARLLVRDLIPLAVPGSSAEDVVTAEVDYSQLDRDGSPLRIRLNSTVVRVQNLGDPSGRSGSGSRLCKWGPGLQRSRRPLRSCLLEYGDPLPVPRLARKTERSAALPGEGSFDIHQRCHPQLDLVAKAWRA